MSRDKEIVGKLLQLGIDHDKSRKALGVVVEEILNADHEGYTRGFNNGYKFAFEKSLLEIAKKKLLEHFSSFFKNELCVKNKVNSVAFKLLVSEEPYKDGFNCDLDKEIICSYFSSIEEEDQMVKMFKNHFVEFCKKEPHAMFFIFISGNDFTNDIFHLSEHSIKKVEQETLQILL